MLPCQTYRLLLEPLPLPSLSLLKKLTFGNVDAIKVAKLLLEKKIHFRRLCHYY